MIEARNLTKKFGNTLAVDNLNLQVRQGEIYGFLGPNGAGKTTTIMMILGILPPTSGDILLMGRKLSDDYFKIRSRLGVLAEFQHLYEEMTALEYLRFFAEFYQVERREKRIDQVLSRLNLTRYKNRLLGAYSKGMKQKLGMARVLLHDPDLLILDEPVSSLDPYGIKEIRDVLLEENNKGKTLFISSHILSEIERTCHRVGIINKGLLVAEDTMAGIKQRVASELELDIELVDVPEGLPTDLEGLDFVRSVRRDGNRIVVMYRSDRDHRADISRRITALGGVIVGMRIKEMSLEDAFVTITEGTVNRLAKEGQAS